MIQEKYSAFSLDDCGPIDRFKVVITGNLDVGKTALLDRYYSDCFYKFEPVVGRDFVVKTVDVFGNKVQLVLWDTARAERFKCITLAFYKGSHCVVLTFDLTNMVSFQDIDYWLKDARQKATEACLLVLVGTKADRVNERVVPQDMAQSLAESIGVEYIETSAKTSANVNALFQSIAETLVRKKGELKRLAAESVAIRRERLDKDRCFGVIMP